MSQKHCFDEEMTQHDSDTPAPEPAQADSKDWTWTLQEPCPDCGADVGSLTISEVIEQNLVCAQGWVDALTNHPAVSERPKPDLWSALEYGCHVRDVHRLYLERMDLMLAEDNPGFADWNPNITAEAERYDLADATIVAAELLQATTALNDRLASLSPEQLERKGLRSDGAQFTVTTLVRYELHDPVHHLWDVNTASNR